MTIVSVRCLVILTLSGAAGAGVLIGYTLSRQDGWGAFMALLILVAWGAVLWSLVGEWL